MDCIWVNTNYDKFIETNKPQELEQYTTKNTLSRWREYYDKPATQGEVQASTGDLGYWEKFIDK